MGSLDRYTCARCGLSFVSGDHSLSFRAEMVSVWCAFCHTVHDFSFVSGDPMKGVVTAEQQRAAGCLKPVHRPYLAWSVRQGCPACGGVLTSELLLDFD